MAVRVCAHMRGMCAPPPPPMIQLPDPALCIWWEAKVH